MKMNKYTIGLILWCSFLFLSLIIPFHEVSMAGRLINSALTYSYFIVLIYLWFPALLTVILCIYLYRVYNSIIWLLLLLFSVYYTFSYSISLSQQYQYLPQLQYVYCFAAMPVTYICIRSSMQRFIFSVFLIGAALFQSITGIAQEMIWMFYQNDFPWFATWLKPPRLIFLHDGVHQHYDTMRVVGTIYDPNNLGLFLVLCSSACIPLYYYLSKIWMQYVFAVGHAILGIGIYLTFSKASWIASGIFVLITIILYGKYFNRYFMIILFIVTLLFAVIEGDRIGRRLSSFDVDSKSNTNRIVALQTSIDMIKDYPLFGIGVGNYYPFYDRYKSNDELESRFYCMNSHLQILVETGLAGFILYTSVIICLFYKCIISSETIYDQRILLALSLFVICINAFFSQMLLLVPNSLYFWSVLGFIYRCSIERNN